MGLRRATSYKGISLPNGFHAVDSIHIDYRAQVVVIGVGVYADRAAMVGGSEALTGMTFSLSGADWDAWFASGKKPHRYAYDYLLARPEFATAVEE